MKISVDEDIIYIIVLFSFVCLELCGILRIFRQVSLLTDVTIYIYIGEIKKRLVTEAKILFYFM